jgi:hypothetical protein
VSAARSNESKAIKLSLLGPGINFSRADDADGNATSLSGSWDESYWRGLPTQLSAHKTPGHWTPSKQRVHRPIYRVHHCKLHRSGDEAAWSQKLNIDPLPVALWLPR